MTSKSKQSRETRFWEWFQANEDRLFNFEREQEKVFGELMRELHRIHKSLTFEFSSVQENKRQFVISADGHREAFPAVIKLGDAAPDLPRWQFIKFRPRRSDSCTVGIGNVMISSDEVEFTLEPEARKVSITLFLGDAKYFDERIFGHIAFLLLDHTLGEYDVETFIGRVDFKPREAMSTLEKRPLQDLPAFFDRFVQSLRN